MTCGLPGRGWVLCRAGSDIGPLRARALPRQPAAVVAELTARGPLGREMPGGKGGDTLEAWAGRTGRRRAAGHGRGGLRFAFYGRVSTEDWQDPVTSRARQRDQAAALVAGHGRIVAGFFDVGYSRTLAWARRPQAAALVAALADPDRGWDAVVIGEYERAFYGASTPRWRRCSSTTASSYGPRKWAAKSTGTPTITRRRCWRWGCSPGGRSRGPGSGSGPRWRPRPASRAATWAACCCTGTGSPTPGRTRTRSMRPGGGGRTGWNRTRRPLRSSAGCSPSGWPDTAPRGSPGP